MTLTVSGLLALAVALAAVHANNEGSNEIDWATNEEDGPLMGPVHVDTDRRGIAADQREERLFELENDGRAIRIWNHSRLPHYFTIAIVTDQLFTITRKRIVLNDVADGKDEDGIARSSHKLFQAIRTAAHSFYAAELKKPENADLPSDSHTLNALVALRYCNVYGAILRNASHILREILDDFGASETLRRDFFHFDEFRRFQRRKRVDKLRRRFGNHITNKYGSFSALIRKRIPAEVLSRLAAEGPNAVPRIHFANGHAAVESPHDGSETENGAGGGDMNEVDNGEDDEDDAQKEEEDARVQEEEAHDASDGDVNDEEDSD